jgi:hypothetical protein
MIVNFFIAGVQKGGTTALDYFLRQHPSVQMASKKEAHFFDNETVDWARPDYGLLHRFFSWERDAVRGEATPIYTYWPNSIERIRRYNAKAKLVVGLRHPSYRAFSHWRMVRETNAEALPFEQAIGNDARERVRLAPGGVHRIFSYLERGLYSVQVDRLRAYFPENQLFFFRTDALWSEPGKTLDGIQRFLELPEQITTERRYVAPLGSSEPIAIPGSVRPTLDDFFAEDMRRVASSTGLNLEDWLDSAYVEPMVP